MKLKTEWQERERKADQAWDHLSKWGEIHLAWICAENKKRRQKNGKEDNAEKDKDREENEDEEEVKNKVEKKKLVEEGKVAENQVEKEKKLRRKSRTGQ